MTGGVGREWALTPILFLIVLAAWPDTTAAQTFGNSNILSSGEPASGPSAQLFNSASSVLFSPPPPSVVLLPPPPPSPSPPPPPPLSPPPPAPTPSPTPASPPPSPTPTTTPPPSPVATSSPTQASSPPPPPPSPSPDPARTTSPTPAPTTYPPASPPPVVSTPGTTTSAGMTPTPTQQPPPPTTPSPTYTPPAASPPPPAAASPPPPASSPPPPALSSPPPPQPTPQVASPPPPVSPSPPPPTPAPTSTSRPVETAAPETPRPTPAVQASPPPPPPPAASSTPGIASGSNSNANPVSSPPPPAEVRNSISPSPPSPPPSAATGQGSISTPGVITTPSPTPAVSQTPNSAASPVPTPSGTALGNATNSTPSALAPSSSVPSGFTRSPPPPPPPPPPPGRTPSPTTSSPTGSSDATSTTSPTPTATAVAPTVSSASTAVPSPPASTSNSTGMGTSTGLSPPGVTNISTPGVTASPVSTVAPARAPTVSTPRQTAAPAPSEDATPPDSTLSGSSGNAVRAVAPAPTPSVSTQNVSVPVPAPSRGTVANATAPAAANTTAPARAPVAANATAPARAPVAANATAPAPAPAAINVTAPAPAPGTLSAANVTTPGRAPAPAPTSGTNISAPAPAPVANASTPSVSRLAPGPAPVAVGLSPGFPAPEAGSPGTQISPGPAPSLAVPVPSPDQFGAFSVSPGPGFGPAPGSAAPEAGYPQPQAAQAPGPSLTEFGPSPDEVAAFSLSEAPDSDPNFTAPGPAPGTGEVMTPGPAPGVEDASLAPGPSPSSASALPGVNGLSPDSAPGPAPQSGVALAPAALAPSFPPLAALAPTPGPLLALETFNGPAPAAGGTFSRDVAFAESALPPSMEAQRQFFDGTQGLAPSPGTPSWLGGAEEIGTNLYYVASGPNSGFYTVVQQPDGTTSTTYAFSTVPSGANVSNYVSNNVVIDLQGFQIYPFNETYQAALMNQLHVALDNANMGHTMYWNSTTNVTNSNSATTGRRLLQDNPDNITSTVGSSNQTATLQVTTKDNVQVSVIVSVPAADRNNLTAIVNNAISSGQVRRGLQEAGANVTDATVTGVSAIQSNANNLSPGSSNTAPPASTSSGGLSGAVIGGAVGGGCAAVAALATLLYWLHTRKLKNRLADLEASPAAKLTDSSSEEGYPYRRNAKYSSNGTSDSDDRPHYIKTMKGGMQDIVLLSNGYTGSMTDYSPYAHSVQPRNGESDRTSPDSAGWEEYRQNILTGIEKAASKNQNSHKIDANLWQVHWNEIQLEHKIGGGSFGMVHLARWRETTVAVKILSGGSIPEENNLAPVSHAMLMALQKEASMMAAMRHPNIVMYIGVCLEVPALVTEYCARGSLHDVLRKWSKRPETAVSWSRRIGMVLDAAKGMNYLHSSDPPVIHRDLKSPNLLVDKHWTVKICDFNLSRAIEESGGNVASSLAATNPRWLAPEILSGKGYNFSSDVYSFGMILWEVLTWTVPWNDIIHWQVVHMVTEQKARPEMPSEDSLPGGSFSGFAEYADLVRACWDQDPEARPKFPQIIEVLRRLMATEAGHGRSDGRASSLGTDHPSSSGFLSYNPSTLNPSTLNHGTSLGPSHDGSNSSPTHQGVSLGPSQAGTSLDHSHLNEIVLIPLNDGNGNDQKRE